MQNDNNKQPSVIKANMKLQQKIGKGPLDEKSIRPAQTIIDKNDVDFAPLCREILTRLETALERSSDPSIPSEHMKELLIAPVMELKANAAIFHYPLIGNLANTVLRFLESILILDTDVIDIVRVHHDTIQMIITRGITGHGGEAGKDLGMELQNACDRYFHKKYRK